MAYAGLFYSGVLEGLSIDQPPAWHCPGLLHPWPLLNNSLLLLLFCASHSLLARHWVKTLFSSLLLVPPSLHRQLHFLQSSFFLFLICYGWTPQPTPALWDFQSTPLRLSLYGVCFLGVVLMTVAFLSLPTLHFVGIQEPLDQLSGNRSESGELVTSGVYGIVRHPMYTGLLVCFWCHPSMTLGRLTMAVFFLLYLLVAVPLFEGLVGLFGGSYRHYQKTTPMLFPLTLWTTKRHSAKDN
jgi:protein-S-isoprenylcysteine O-methyltransferase Ste14